MTQLIVSSEPGFAKRRMVLKALFLLAAGCGLTERVKEAAKIRNDVKSELGIDADVAVSEVNGQVVVRVVLHEKPTKELALVRKRVETIASRHVTNIARVDVFTKF